jgi:hypothetical protein
MGERTGRRNGELASVVEMEWMTNGGWVSRALMESE